MPVSARRRWYASKKTRTPQVVRQTRTGSGVVTPTRRARALLPKYTPVDISPVKYEYVKRLHRFLPPTTGRSIPTPNAVRQRGVSPQAFRLLGRYTPQPLSRAARIHIVEMRRAVPPPRPRYDPRLVTDLIGASQGGALALPSPLSAVASWTTFGVVTRRHVAVTGETYYLEVVLKSSSASFPVSARLFNITDNVAVSNSTLQTFATSPTRLRSGPLVLTGDKSYRIEFTGPIGATYTIYSGDLVIVTQNAASAGSTPGSIPGPTGPAGPPGPQGPAGADGSGALVYSERATQAVAAGTTIAVTDGTPVTPITTSGNVTSTAAPFIAAGRDGQMVIIRNDNAASTLTLQDAGALAGSLLRLSAASLVMAAGSHLALVYSAITGAWTQQYYLAPVTITPTINSHTINIGAGASNSQNAEVASSGTHTPTFAWTYTGVPSAGTVDIDSGEVSGSDYPATILTPFLTLVGPAFNKGTSVGTVRTFTPSITVNGVVKTTPTATITYINRRFAGPANFGGTGAIPTVDTGARSLDDTANGVSGLSTSQYGTFAVTVGAAEYAYFSHRSALTAVAFMSINGEICGFTDLGTNNQINDSGFGETFRSYRTNQQNLGAISLVTSASRLTNRIYVGPHVATAILTAEILTIDDTADGVSVLDPTVAGSYVVDIDGLEYLWVCHPDAINDIVTIKDNSTGFAIAGSYRTDVLHTNDRGFQENYRVWRSDNPGIFPSGGTVDIT